MNKVVKKANPLKEMAQIFPIDATVHKGTDGSYWVDSPDLVGCFARGKSPQEAIHNFKFAIFDYFEIPNKLQKPAYFALKAVEVPDPSERHPDTVQMLPNEMAFA